MIDLHESLRFDEVLQNVLLSEHARSGIGTLGERTLHAVLKRNFEPDTEHHEIKVGRYVADILRGDEITEIQTRSFRSLRPKLLAYRGNYRVNVGYPIARTKYLSWVDPDTGEVGGRRRSPKAGKPWDVLYELYALRPILPLEGVRFTLIFCDMDEYRLQNGWGRDKKHGASRFERVPTALCDILTLEKPEDFAALLPETLGERFTTAEFAKAAKMTRTTAGYGIRTLETLGVIEKTDKIKNAYIYTRIPRRKEESK